MSDWDTYSGTVAYRHCTHPLSDVDVDFAALHNVDTVVLVAHLEQVAAGGDKLGLHVATQLQE